MHYARMYTDAAGDTHFSDVEVALALVNYAPSAPPVHLAAFTEATRCTFCAIPAGWFGDAHPSPRRQFFTFLAGTWEVSMSDGEVRRFRPGGVVLVEDTTGRDAPPSCSCRTEHTVSRHALILWNGSTIYSATLVTRGTPPEGTAERSPGR